MTDIDRDLLSTLPCRYGTITFPHLDNTIGLALTRCGEWAQAEIDLLLPLVGRGDTVLDVGAYLGTHTLALSRAVGQEGKVYAIEPHPVRFWLLAENVGHNGLSNVILGNFAIADAPGTMWMSEMDLRSEANFGQGAASDDMPSLSSVKVPVRTVDSLGLERCDLIKADVEGMEPRMLQGSAETLAMHRPVVYLECLTLDAGWVLFQSLRDIDYQVWLHQAQAYNPDNWFGSSERIFGLASESNLLGLPKERPIPEDSLPADGSLMPITSLDTLARALLDTPRGGEAQLESETKAGLVARVYRLREDKARLEARAHSVLMDLQAKGAEADEARHEAATLRAEADEARHEAATLRQERTVALERAGHLQAELARTTEAYSTSTSWRVTRPLRAAGQLIRTVRVARR